MEMRTAEAEEQRANAEKALETCLDKAEALQKKREKAEKSLREMTVRCERSDERAADLCKQLEFIRTRIKSTAYDDGLTGPASSRNSTHSIQRLQAVLGGEEERRKEVEGRLENMTRELQQALERIEMLESQLNEQPADQSEERIQRIRAECEEKLKECEKDLSFFKIKSFKMDQAIKRTQDLEKEVNELLERNMELTLRIAGN